MTPQFTKKKQNHCGKLLSKLCLQKLKVSVPLLIET